MGHKKIREILTKTWEAKAAGAVYTFLTDDLRQALEEILKENPDPRRGLEGERTGAYRPVPEINLICAKCGKACRAIAHNTGDGWLMSLECGRRESRASRVASSRPWASR